MPHEVTKILHLVEPEELEALNITDPVESPVFISPYWLHTDTCLACHANNRAIDLRIRAPDPHTTY